MGAPWPRHIELGLVRAVGAARGDRRYKHRAPAAAAAEALAVRRVVIRLSRRGRKVQTRPVAQRGAVRRVGPTARVRAQEACVNKLST